jgi:hypothetical protein
VTLNVCALDLQALPKVSSEQNIGTVLRVLSEFLLNVLTIVKEDILFPGFFQ